jgi:hypothetical protein
MKIERRARWAGVAFLVLAAAITATAQQDKSAKDPRDPRDKDQGDKDKRPKLTLTARPPISMSPARVAITAELVGGPNDLEDFYCPTIEWDWGDGTQSETTSDCEPYEAGKSTYKRRFTVEHVFRAGYHRVSLRLKKHDKAISSATVVVDVRPGIRDL